MSPRYQLLFRYLIELGEEFDDGVQTRGAAGELRWLQQLSVRSLEPGRSPGIAALEFFDLLRRGPLHHELGVCTIEA